MGKFLISVILLFDYLYNLLINYMLLFLKLLGSCVNYENLCVYYSFNLV